MFSHHPQTQLQFKLLLPTKSFHIKVEKPSINKCLDAATNNCKDIIKPFNIVSVDPVEDEEKSVDTEGEDVVAEHAGGEG